MTAGAPEPPQMVRLSAAVLCQDCDTISNTRYAQCPACGSPSLLPLARVLNRTASPAGQEEQHG